MIELKGEVGAILQSEDGVEFLQKARAAVERVRGDVMAGWVDWPEKYAREEVARLKMAAEKIRRDSEVLVCVGIGGSYLGHRAVIEALGGERGGVKILYAGNSLSARALKKLLIRLEGCDFSVNVISKSGTTTEPAIAFRVLKQKLIEKYGEAGAVERIYATTDAARGALYDEAHAQNYESFVVPDNVGGRYSVFTAVGLLAIAVAGYDIEALLQGAAEERSVLLNSDGGSAAEYAAARNVLFRNGYNIEILVNFEPQFGYFNEWWKQLFGESEGKEGTGIFPASVINTTDLHSMGQYIQEGRRSLFETFVEIEAGEAGMMVPNAENDLDGLNYLVGKELDEINKSAAEATRVAHRAGGVPVLEVVMPDLLEQSLGALIYFFEMSCAISGMVLGVNPFNQPGVEAYKKKMFELLGKPQ